MNKTMVGFKRIVLAKPCKCGCLSAIIDHYRGTNVVSVIICDGCGRDLV